MSIRVAERGQVLVMAAAVMSLLFVPLCVFVVDTALVEAAYAQLGETLQTAAEDGASMIDVNVYRQSNGSIVHIDPSKARATGERSLEASGMPGLDTSQVEVHGDTVTVSASVNVRLMVAGAVRLSATRSASFARGT